MINSSKIFDEIKNSTDKSGLVKLVAALVIAILVVVLNFFFLPTSIAAINLVALLVVAALAIANYDRLAHLSIEGGAKNLELETVIQNIRDGILVYDPNFKILSVNRAAEEIFGIEAQEILGRPIEPELVKNPHLRAVTETIFPSLAPSMTVISDADWPKIIDITLDGPKRELRTVLNRISNNKGEVVGFLKIVTDLTREKAIIESKSEFIAVAAHQLRTPLTALNWSFESLNKILAEKNPDTKGAADIAKEGWQLTERSLRIVNDLLNAARIEEGRSGFNFEQVELADFLKIIVKQAEPVAREMGVKIELDPGAPGLTVKIDKELMGMALANLIDNGIKYNSKNGEVKISAGLDTKPGVVRVDISDSGVGIPQEGFSKIFQKFYRGSNVVQMEPNGSGLGLYITKNIVEGHGGKISVESQLGRGTQFSITLPLSSGPVPGPEERI